MGSRCSFSGQYCVGAVPMTSTDLLSGHSAGTTAGATHDEPADPGA